MFLLSVYDMVKKIFVFYNEDSNIIIFFRVINCWYLILRWNVRYLFRVIVGDVKVEIEVIMKLVMVVGWYSV